MASLWRPVQGVSISAKGNERFLFQFYHELDISRIQNYGPWTYENRLLLTTRIHEDDDLQQVPINTMPI